MPRCSLSRFENPADRQYSNSSSSQLHLLGLVQLPANVPAERNVVPFNVLWTSLSHECSNGCSGWLIPLSEPFSCPTWCLKDRWAFLDDTIPLKIFLRDIFIAEKGRIKIVHSAEIPEVLVSPLDHVGYINISEIAGHRRSR